MAVVGLTKQGRTSDISNVHALASTAAGGDDSRRMVGYLWILDIGCLGLCPGDVRKSATAVKYTLRMNRRAGGLSAGIQVEASVGANLKPTHGSQFTLVSEEEPERAAPRVRKYQGS